MHKYLSICWSWAIVFNCNARKPSYLEGNPEDHKFRTLDKMSSSRWVCIVVGLQYTLSRLVEAREIGQIGHIPTPNHCDTALTLHNVLQVHNVIRMFDVQMYCQTWSPHVKQAHWITNTWILIFTFHLPLATCSVAESGNRKLRFAHLTALNLARNLDWTRSAKGLYRRLRGIQLCDSKYNRYALLHHWNIYLRWNLTHKVYFVI